jgi:hypothetical protein
MSSKCQFLPADPVEMEKTNTGKNACATCKPVSFVQTVAQAFLPVWILERFFQWRLDARKNDIENRTQSQNRTPLSASDDRFLSSEIPSEIPVLPAPRYTEI